MTYKEIVDNIASIVSRHYIIQDFGYGALTDIKTVNDDGTQRVNYPYVFLNPTQSARTGQSITYRFNLIAMDVCEEEQGYSNWLEVQSACQQYISDILAQLRFGQPLLKADLSLNVNLTPFKERFQDTLAGMTATLEIEVPDSLNDCIVPINQLVKVNGGLGYPYASNFYKYSADLDLAPNDIICGIFTGDFPNNPGDKTLPATGWRPQTFYVLESDIDASSNYGLNTFEGLTQLYNDLGVPWTPDPNLLDGNDSLLLAINRLDLGITPTQQTTIDGVGVIAPDLFSTSVLTINADGTVGSYQYGNITGDC